MAKIYVIMGKSSTGKDTVYGKICEADKNLKTVVLYTTRPMRDGEEAGKTYFYTDEAHVDLYESQGKIIELRAYNTVFGIWKYFTLDDGQIDINGNDKYIIIGTIEAYNKFVNYFGKDKVVPIYIEIDDGTRIKRAISREEQQKIPKYAEMCRRFLADEEDFAEAKLIEAGITKRYKNVILENCVQEIISDIDKDI